MEPRRDHPPSLVKTSINTRHEIRPVVIKVKVQIHLGCNMLWHSQFKFELRPTLTYPAVILNLELLQSWAYLISSLSGDASHASHGTFLSIRQSWRNSRSVYTSSRWLCLRLIRNSISCSSRTCPKDHFHPFHTLKQHLLLRRVADYFWSS